MALLTPPPLAPQRKDKATFSDRFDAFITWIVNFVTELLALVAGLNSLATGGAYALAYTVDLSSTADGDPTPGKLRLNASTQNAATALYLDLLGADGVDNTSILDQFDASSSTVKGQIRIVKQGDQTQFLTFDIIARTTATGYRKLTVTNTGGSSPNPFGASESVLIKFTRTGDRGDKGDAGAAAVSQVLYVREELASGTASGTSSTTAAWVTCVLNTVKVNEISGASLSANQIVLPAGTYEFEGSSPVYAQALTAHKTQLYNVTDATVIDAGTVDASNATATSTYRSVLRGRFTISAAKTIALRRFVNATNAGSASFSSAGVVEVYAELKFKKVA
jgi:hypothetical protein